jgi:hypothetical protein
MRVQKFHVYLMRKGDWHYEDVGDRVVSLSDDRRDAWLEVDGTELYTCVRRGRGPVPSRSGTVGEIFLDEQ